MRFAIRVIGGRSSAALLPAIVLFFSCIAGAIAQNRIHEPRYAVIQIPGPGGGLDYVYSINDFGRAVGESYLPDRSTHHPFFWNGSSTIDLGQIAANGVLHSDPNGSRMFLLTPIDPEMELQNADGPLRADAINTFRITNAHPGATIKFFYGKKGGGHRIPGCDVLDAMV